MDPRAGLDMCEISRPTGIRSPDSQALIESLYRLSYRGPRRRGILRVTRSEREGNIKVESK